MLTNSKKQLEMITQQIKELCGVYRDAVSTSGISENELWIWYTLIVMEGDYTQQDICTMWSISKQTVNTIITHMVQKQYATLSTIPGTRNRKIIQLTEAGRAYGEAIVLPISGAEQRAIDRMSSKDRIACTLAIRNYIQLLKEELARN